MAIAKDVCYASVKSDILYYVISKLPKNVGFQKQSNYNGDNEMIMKKKPTLFQNVLKGQYSVIWLCQVVLGQINHVFVLFVEIKLYSCAHYATSIKKII